MKWKIPLVGKLTAKPLSEGLDITTEYGYAEVEDSSGFAISGHVINSLSVTPSEVGISTGAIFNRGAILLTDSCSSTVWDGTPAGAYPDEQPEYLTEEEIVEDERRRIVALNLAIRSFPPDFVLKQSDTVVYTETADMYYKYIKGNPKRKPSAPVSDESGGGIMVTNTGASDVTITRVYTSSAELG